MSKQCNYLSPRELALLRVRDAPPRRLGEYTTADEQRRIMTTPALYVELHWLADRLDGIQHKAREAGTNVTATQLMEWESDSNLTQRALDAVRAELDRRGVC